MRGSHSLIHIEIHQRPLRTQGNIVHILLDVLFQIILMPGLIEIPDVHPDFIRGIWHGIFMRDAVQPQTVTGKDCFPRVLLDVTAQHIGAALRKGRFLRNWPCKPCFHVCCLIHMYCLLMR